jgi:dTDP-4-amino-4,6-dideoxygalactose transaminase
MIFTSFSPNTQPDDVRLAAKLLLKPWKWQEGTTTLKLENEFKHYFRTKHAFAVNNGRTALLTILQALGISKGDEVLVQAYTCVAVPEPVLWLGAKPVYVDCEGETLGMDPTDLRRKITSKAKVVIIQHTLGNPAQIDEIMAIARQYGLIVIEDCAHALGAEYKGKKVGTFGAASFFSFGRDKVISSVFGGMIITQDEALAKRIGIIRNSFETPSKLWIFRQLLHPLILTLAKATYTTKNIGKIIMTIARRLSIISVAVEKTELSGGKPTFAFKKMPEALAALALKQFKKLEMFNAHRKEIAALYERELREEKIGLLAENGSGTNIFLRFPLFLENPKELIAFAKTKDIELGNWYQDPIAPAGVDTEAIGYGSNPTAEQLAALSVNLPTSIQIQEKDAKKIIFMIREYLTKM